MLKNFFLICLSTLISLAVLEMALRLFDPLGFQPHVSRDLANVPLVNDENYFCTGGPKRLIPHPVVYSRETPNQSYFEFRNDIATFVKINEQGFRGVFDPGDGQERVIVLGDSFIRGSLSDETETIPALLSEWSADTHFVNLGTGGHGTLQHALTYDEFKSQIPHETVLLFIFNRNDLVDNIRFQKWQQNPKPISHEPTATQRLKRAFAKLYVGKLVLSFKNALFDQNLYPSVPTEMEEALLLQSLADLSQSVTDQGAELIVFSLPDISEFLGKDTITFRDDPVGYSDAVRRLIARAAEQNGFAYLNLKPGLIEMSENLDLPTAELYGTPDHHLREIGSFAVANLVAQFLEVSNVAAFTPDAEFVDRMHVDPANVACP